MNTNWLLLCIISMASGGLMAMEKTPAISHAHTKLPDDNSGEDIWTVYPNFARPSAVASICPENCACVACLKNTEQCIERFVRYQLPHVIYMKRRMEQHPLEPQSPLELSSRSARSAAEIPAQTQCAQRIAALLLQSSVSVLPSPPVPPQPDPVLETTSTHRVSGPLPVSDTHKVDKKSEKKKKKDKKADTAGKETKEKKSSNAGIVILPANIGNGNEYLRQSQTLLTPGGHSLKHL